MQCAACIMCDKERAAAGAALTGTSFTQCRPRHEMTTAAGRGKAVSSSCRQHCMTLRGRRKSDQA